ncbi:MAG: C2H2-type zinc finger protein [Dehalococcoidales bacterium]|nr:C2H2-type zinc finger protein [Dehalococcoidales bacterium]
MNRGSKYNPYQCPECSYKTTRKANMKVHLARMHGLAPDLPGLSQEDWLDRQVQSLANKYVQVKSDGDEREASRIYSSLTALYYRHRDVLTLEHISRALERAKKRL